MTRRKLIAAYLVILSLLAAAATLGALGHKNF
jgi:hypothetical protein